MEVTFRRTGSRRYGVEVVREGYPDAVMEPAPGYDDALPHDMIHFVVEEELGLEKGVFGQLAGGGDAGTFRLPQGQGGDVRELRREKRKVRRRGSRLAEEGRKDTALSERAAAICEYEWKVRSDDPSRRREAESMSSYSDRLRSECTEQELQALSPEVLGRIRDRLTKLSREWQGLGVGEAVTLRWRRAGR